MRILVVSGSTRRASLNTRLAGLAARVRGADEVALVSELHRLPFYDGDLEAAGVPSPVRELRAGIAAADAVVFVTPEYNGTVPGVLANAIDWLSRPHDASVLRDKAVVVLSASPSRFGGVRAARHLREVLERIGAAVSPSTLSVARAHERLEEDGPDPELAEEVARVLHEALDPVPAGGSSLFAVAA